MATIGLYGNVYISSGELADVLADARRLAIVAASGIDQVAPLERLALLFLKSSGRLPATSDSPAGD